MKRKSLVIVSIGVAVVIVGILGFSFIHSGTDAVETMVETNMTVATDDFPAGATEKDESTEEEPPMEEIASTDETVRNDSDTEQETHFVKEIEEEQESPEPDIAEAAQTESLEGIDIYMYTTADFKMRMDGSTESDVIEVIPYGTQIHLTARTADNWYRTEGSEIGYVSGKYLSEEEPTKQTGQDSAQQQTQSAGQGATPNSISQEEMEQLEALIKEFNPNQGPYTGPTMEMKWEGSGGRRLDGTNAWE